MTVKKKPLVYIAGPYTHPEPSGNVRRAIEVAEIIEAHGCTPFIPHLNMLWDLIRPAPYEMWLQRDNEVLLHCDGLVRFAGESAGADAEVALARANGIRTFNFDKDGMAAFTTWREAQGSPVDANLPLLPAPPPPAAEANACPACGSAFWFALWWPCDDPMNTHPWHALEDKT